MLMLVLILLESLRWVRWLLLREVRQRLGRKSDWREEEEKKKLLMLYVFLQVNITG